MQLPVIQYFKSFSHSHFCKQTGLTGRPQFLPEPCVDSSIYRLYNACRCRVTTCAWPGTGSMTPTSFILPKPPAPRVSLLQVTPETLDQVLGGLENREISYRTCSTASLRIRPACFQPLVEWATRHKSFCVNPQKRTLWSGDKATMHLEFISRGLYTPYTTTLPPIPNIPLSNRVLIWGRWAGVSPSNRPVRAAGTV